MNSTINIEKAYKSISKMVIRTPVRRLGWLEEIVGVPVWIKLEHQQHTGSFKYRGAFYTLFKHPKHIQVIVASAGNHGLAMAQVGKQLGIKVNVCLPANASRLKRQRILNTGAGLIEYGASLDEAITHAKKLALNNNWRFVSPYNDVDLISSGGTIALEFLEDVPDLKYLIVPVGGGGLISGIGLAAHATSPNIEILGCEPENYPSMTHSLLKMQETRVPNIPTYADGLAVNLEANSITLNLVKQYVKEIISLSEEDLAFGTFALLNKESLLVEPSGCAGIAALIHYHKKVGFKGPVGIPMCGGNIQKNTLHRILEHHFTTPIYTDILDLRGSKLADTPIVVSYGTFQPATDLNKTKDYKTQNIITQLNKIIQDIDELHHDIYSHIQFCITKELPYDDDVIKCMEAYLSEIKKQLMYQLDKIKCCAIVDSIILNLAEIKIRWGLQGLSHAKSAIEWRAAAYDQSNASQFFDLSSQDNPGMNYDRYFSPEVKRIEDQLRDILSVPRDTFGVSLTSSGMAAYTLIESFLVRYILTPTSTILTTPYIYFEAKEQLEGLKGINLKTTENFNASTILYHLENDETIDIIFADPLANIVEQPMTDINFLIDGIRKLKRKTPIRLVIDGTMVSAGLLPGILTSSSDIEVIYYESCSKYLQLGLESCLAGIVVYPIYYQAHFERLRRNTGAILYRQQAFSYPFFDKEVFSLRMKRLSDNAFLLAKILSSNLKLLRSVEIYHPLLPTHADYLIATTLPYCGGCVTLQFRDKGKNNNNFLDAFITNVLNNARKEKISLVKGVSFGYTFPRISAASSIAESEFPFLRLYVGDLGKNFIKKLAKIMEKTFVDTLDNG